MTTPDTPLPAVTATSLDLSVSTAGPAELVITAFATAVPISVAEEDIVITMRAGNIGCQQALLHLARLMFTKGLIIIGEDEDKRMLTLIHNLPVSPHPTTEGKTNE